MEYTKALSQISEIHAQLAKGEVYRGFRSLPVALSGVMGIAAALAQPRLVPTDELAVVLRYWVVAGVVCGLIGGTETALNYILREDMFARRRTRKVLGQFVPGLAAGAALTVGFARQGDAFVLLLPGTWALVFGLGIFAARPYLPRASGWVGLFYLAAGCLGIAMPPASAQVFGWVVGGTFGAGQLAAALMLFWNVERAEHG
ncbi:MAG: hypothetical protein HYX69_03080 [Planctomycetia bacterium]|nr:hypothetical protein [Planctomycetia bacterium]